MSFVDNIVAQVEILETRLHVAAIRLRAATDDEALHDLRINLRRLRSLLRPFRQRDGVAELDNAAAAVGRLTTPVRDLEVLIGVLEQLGLAQQVNHRKALLHSCYGNILASPTLKQLFARLEEWPEGLRAAEHRGELRQLKQTVIRRLRKQAKQLRAALQDPTHDRHQLRILVKRLRYAIDAYPALSPISKKATASLKTVQSALGDWHDHYQWALRAGREQDLQTLEQSWRSQAQASLAKAEVALLQLARQLNKS